MRPHPQPVPSPSVKLPEPHGDSLPAEVLRLRRMVHVMAEMLVEHGIVDAAMIEGRLRLAVEGPLPQVKGEVEVPSLKPPGFFARLWARLFSRRARPDDFGEGAVPSVMMPSSSVDQTVPVEKLPFEVQSLYDETGHSQVGSAPRQTVTRAARSGTCNRCWRRGLVNTGSLCVRCATSHG